MQHDMVIHCMRYNWSNFSRNSTLGDMGLRSARITFALNVVQYGIACDQFQAKNSNWLFLTNIHWQRIYESYKYNIKIQMKFTKQYKPGFFQTFFILTILQLKMSFLYMMTKISSFELTNLSYSVQLKTIWLIQL